jgi:hypothetical protein
MDARLALPASHIGCLTVQIRTCWNFLSTACCQNHQAKQHLYQSSSASGYESRLHSSWALAKGSDACKVSSSEHATPTATLTAQSNAKAAF